jgi:DNA-binding NarL/FixJ family response regulator
VSGPPIRVVVADDQALFREGLRVLLGTAGDVEVVAEAADGAAAVKACESLRPDVVLMDLRMPGVGGVEATRLVRERAPATRVLVLTTFDDDASVFDALAAGALGYLLKDTPPARLFEALRAAARGESLLEPAVASKVVAQFARLAEASPTHAATAARSAGLSDREVDVLRRLAAGESNKEIASALRIAEGTVKNHLTNVFEKLGVGDRTQAALAAKRLGIVG